MTQTAAARPSAPTDAQAAPAGDPLAPHDGGWHCSHLYYSFDRAALAALAPAERDAIAADLRVALDPAADHAPVRMQASITSGHKADFGLMLLDPNPLRIDGVHQRLMSGPAGPVLRP
ncbi:MAG: heme-dependent peroxidase, partial [Planctomycetota bacterium]